uniref:Uncharacterized protein n=1 Tax=Ciona intestinalis TaxID=7719 RepID=H2XK03_CIOIN
NPRKHRINHGALYRENIEVTAISTTIGSRNFELCFKLDAIIPSYVPWTLVSKNSIDPIALCIFQGSENGRFNPVVLYKPCKRWQSEYEQPQIQLNNYKVNREFIFSQTCWFRLLLSFHLIRISICNIFIFSIISFIF